MAGYWTIYMQGSDGRYANFNNMIETTFQGLWSNRLAMYDSPAGVETVLRNGGYDFEGGPNAALAALFEALVPVGDSLLLWAADNGGEGAECFGNKAVIAGNKFMIITLPIRSIWNKPINRSSTPSAGSIRICRL